MIASLSRQRRMTTAHAALGAKNTWIDMSEAPRANPPLDELGAHVVTSGLIQTMNDSKR